MCLLPEFSLLFDMFLVVFWPRDLVIVWPPVSSSSFSVNQWARAEFCGRELAHTPSGVIIEAKSCRKDITIEV